MIINNQANNKSKKKRSPLTQATEIYNSVLADLMRSKHLTRQSLSYFTSSGNEVSTCIIMCVASICALQQCADENEPVSTLFPIIDALRQHLKLPPHIYQLSSFSTLFLPLTTVSSNSTSQSSTAPKSIPPLSSSSSAYPPVNSIEAEFLSILHSFHCLIGQLLPPS
jgi:hypothetical protein